MRFKKTYLLLFVFILIFIYSCGKVGFDPAMDTSTDTINSRIAMAPQNPTQLLEFVNHWATTDDLLKYTVELTITQANNIFNHKKGADGIYGTSDDNLFDSIEELDDVPYVGQATIDKLDAYASDIWSMETDKIHKYYYTLEHLNHRLLNYNELRKDIGLTGSLPETLLTFRAGNDLIIGTADDIYFDNIKMLDDISGVGPATLNKISNYYNKRNLCGVESIYKAKVYWGLTEYATQGEFEFNAKLKLKTEIDKNNILPQSEIIFNFGDTVLIQEELVWETGEKPDKNKNKDNKGKNKNNSNKGHARKNNWKLDNQNKAVIKKAKIKWLSDTEAILNMKLIFDNSVLPSDKEDTFTQDWQIIFRLGNNPFTVFDRIGDDDVWLQSENDQGFTNWEYNKIGNFPNNANDFDNDGLSDDYEDSIGTNPKLFDSDGEGIPDGVELLGYKTDPMNIDSDLDGIQDHHELAGTNGYITNPAISDTDGDSLPDGFEVKYGYNPLELDSDYNGISDGDEDPDYDGRPNWNEAKYYTNPNVQDTESDAPPFKVYVKRFNPGPGGAEGIPFDVSIGLGGSITYGYTDITVSASSAVYVKILDGGPVDENFDVSVTGSDNETLSGSLSGTLEVEILLGSITSSIDITITDNSSEPDVESPYKGADISITSSVFTVTLNPSNIKLFTDADAGTTETGEEKTISVSVSSVGGLTENSLTYDIDKPALLEVTKNTDGTQLTIKSKDDPGSDKDVTIKAKYNTIEVGEITAQVLKPQLDSFEKVNKQYLSDPATVTLGDGSSQTYSGFRGIIVDYKYKIVDQTNAIIEGIEIKETSPGVVTFQSTDSSGKYRDPAAKLFNSSIYPESVFFASQTLSLGHIIHKYGSLTIVDQNRTLVISGPKQLNSSTLSNFTFNP